jgi:hypothetical protein
MRPLTLDEPEPARTEPGQHARPPRQLPGRDAATAELYTVRCTGLTPRAGCGAWTIELTDPLPAARTRRHGITLHGSIPWEIEVVGAVGDVRPDRTQLWVRSIEGDTARTSLDPTQPERTVSIRLRAINDQAIADPDDSSVDAADRPSARSVDLTATSQTLPADVMLAAHRWFTRSPRPESSRPRRWDHDDACGDDA